MFVGGKFSVIAMKNTIIANIELIPIPIFSPLSAGKENTKIAAKNNFLILKSSIKRCSKFSIFSFMNPTLGLLFFRCYRIFILRYKNNTAILMKNNILCEIYYNLRLSLY